MYICVRAYVRTCVHVYVCMHTSLNYVRARKFKDICIHTYARSHEPAFNGCIRVYVRLFVNDATGYVH